MVIEITITGLCTYNEINDIGWTRERIQPLLDTLIAALPESIANHVSSAPKLIGYRNMKLMVKVEGGIAKEVQQRWKE